MFAWRRFGSALIALATLVCASACGDDDGTTGDTDAGLADAGMGGADAGVRPDGGSDAGHDAGPSCTEGCEYVELALGSQYSCARRENGDVRCWGRGQEGQLGDGLEAHGGRCRISAADSRDCSSRPVDVALDEPADSIAGGLLSACAVDAAGAVRCWGEVGYRLGALPAESARFAPRLYPMLDDTAEVAEGTFLLCSLENDGSVRCAGRNGSRQTGTGELASEVLDPTAVIRRVDETTTEPLAGVLELDVGTFSSFACARTAGEVHCWGSGQAGELGVAPSSLTANCGTATQENRCSEHALPISGLESLEVTQVALGGEHACVLISDGTVQCWGSNRAGQLGTDDADQRFAPAPVPGITAAIEITAGANHTCAVLSDGTVQCWGFNHQGQLGDGQESHGLTATCTLGETQTGDCWATPVTVMGLSGVTHIDAGTNHTCAIHDEGAAISCWGANEMLQVGGVTTNNPSGSDLAPRFTPTAVLGL